jgi:hypothetical protein
MLRPTVSLLLTSILVGACAEPIAPEPEDSTWATTLDRVCDSNAAANSLPKAKLDEIGPYRGHPYMDSQWAEIARQVPGGWGGLYYERAAGRQQGALTIVLVDPTQQDRAVEALSRLFRGTGWERLIPELPNAVVQQGRWDFAQLFDWYRYLNRHVGQESGVTMSDIQESMNRIEYGVADEAARERLTRRLQGLNLPCFLVAIDIVPPAQTR